MIENDAVFAAPALEELERDAARLGEDVKAVADRRLAARGRLLAMAKADPFRYGWEPDFWLVCRALLGAARLPDVVRIRLAERTGHDAATVWPWWSERLLSNLGLRFPVDELLANGANASGKTDFAAKLSQETGQAGGLKIEIGSQQWQTSVEVQQARMWKYLPREIREHAGARPDPEYVRYTAKNGFTGNSFILRGGTRFGFVFYTQDQDKVFEGRQGNFYWMDEELPLSWLETIRYRLARVRGKLVVTFTPISGYTPAVADYQDGMRVVRWRHAYMLPRDGGAPAPWAAVGLTREEMDLLERQSHAKVKLPQTVPSARPEECAGWAEAPWRDRDENLYPDRVWELVPRLALCRDPHRAVVWFHGSDNPYGLPLENIKKAAANPQARDEIKTRIYGIALKRVGKRFKQFDRKTHVAEEVIGKR
jgi:hypothetical protein